MGMTIAQKILKEHLVDGEMVQGQEIGFRIDQTLTQDATGTMAYLQFEAMGVDQVRTCLLYTSQSGYDLPRVALAYCSTELPELDLDDPAAVSPLGGQEQTEQACARHAGAVRAIYQEAASRVEELGMRKLYYEIELPLMRILAEMETVGCAVAPDELRAFCLLYTSRCV